MLHSEIKTILGDLRKRSKNIMVDVQKNSEGKTVEFKEIFCDLLRDSEVMPRKVQNPSREV